MKLYTIGFTQKSAQEFFELLAMNDVDALVDIRLNPSGQLSGFARQRDLPFFLDRLANGCKYVYMAELAPTKEILKDYRSNRDWNVYERRFEALMDERDIPDILDREFFKEHRCCLLCSEATADQCHRRLIAERMSNQWSDLEIVHL